MVGISSNVNQLGFKSNQISNVKTENVSSNKNVENKKGAKVSAGTGSVETRPADFPSSNKKYEKNGKKVKSNIGTLGAIIVSACTAGSLAVPSIKNVLSNKSQLSKIKSNLDKYNGIELEHAKNAIKSLTKEIKKEKRLAWIAPLVAVAATIGGTLLVNNHRNKKREQLYNEPIK